MKNIIRSIYETVEEAIFYSNLDPSKSVDIPDRCRGNNKDYQKFILISHYRSASSVVINTLQKHPNVFRFAEIFLPWFVQFKQEGYDDRSRKMYYFRKQYPIDFLEKQIFAGYPDDIKAMGFKLFPEQLDFPNMLSVWKWIESHPDIKIIHLTRDDLLAYYTSYVLARETGVWGVRKGNSVAQKQTINRKEKNVRLDFKKCLKAFERRKELDLYTLDRCKNNQMLRISYEEVVGDMNYSLKRIQNFIGVSPLDLEVHTCIQQKRALSEVISNYSELKDMFSDTEWSYLFK
ncbi:MAG: sulfotransferase [Synechococcus sp.]